MTPELLPRPRPHVTQHAVDRAERIEFGPRAAIEAVCAVVQEGREILDPVEAPWLMLVQGHRYFVDRSSEPRYAVVVAAEDWVVVTVLERLRGEQRHLVEPHARRLAARRVARAV